MDPLVSVIMPAYNGEKYIGEAIESVLNQTYGNLELIVVEDKSTDATPDLIRRYQDSRIRLYFNDRNQGIAYSTNLGIEKSRGKYIALLDDDDIALERRLEWQVDFLEKHEEIDVLGGRSALIDKDGNFIGYDKEPIYNPKYIKANLLF
ncbi:MAG: glycosyltransferase family 2 protein [Lachnospiraceae bacterium]|nr:glycosyltransferase family 2 protein [Lachnospiraceae bacterium]